MAEISLTIDHDRVTIEGQVIRRPNHIGVVQWFDFWEPYDYESGYDYREGSRRGYRDGERHRR